MQFKELPLYRIGHSINIVGMVFGGEGKHFLCLMPTEAEGPDLEVLEMTVDEWAECMRQLDTLETEVLRRAPDGSIAKILLRKSQRQIDAHMQWRVFKRDGYMCRYCGRDDVPLTVDHLVCWEHGGPTTEANMVSACKKCNKARGNTLYADWLGHPHYLKVSKNLSEHTRRANTALVETLDKIPRLVNIRSR